MQGLYMKAVFAVIAGALVILAVENVPFMSSAHAQYGITRVAIAQIGPFAVTSDALPVRVQQ
ncbi:hypothetical protein NFI95_15730 [Acetobacteraceae bacterium KSS8]|uniref:Uncharacterized protein n=1 Tax=Endosaccharibacter trunci TaxID=2812733 RepID=A0ABT1WAH6_9PROT|nr:hypothetical protein [Acetobacteraceae bacterium KSS8]